MVVVCTAADKRDPDPGSVVGVGSDTLLRVNYRTSHPTWLDPSLLYLLRSESSLTVKPASQEGVIIIVQGRSDQQRQIVIHTGARVGTWLH